ncbi:MAG: chromosomal replication initiator protein DnaA [Nitrospirae bacterium]|nr:chromosomal replication initiator protein DnaA [Nitrospirota bacterium]
MMDTQEIWERSIERVKAKVGPAQFKMWFANVRCERGASGRFVLETQDKFQADWIRENYADLLRQTVSEVSSDNLEVEIAQRANGTSGAESPAATPPPALKRFDDHASWNYTFDNFVVGASNQFAHASALAIAKDPGRKYNPLLIYGGVGLGKTHLIHAIANHLTAQGGLAVHSTTSQDFEHNLIAHLRSGTLDEFRAKYRKVDVLLIDDIQFWATKERTQQEFFFVFNTLFERRRQMVFTSDNPPNEITGLHERLISRFSRGLMADIQPPDIETKVAILQKKAEFFQLSLSDDVAFTLASRITSNIRDLEGCLTRLAAHCAFSQEPITAEYLQAHMDTIMPGRREKPSPDELVRAVAAEFNLKPADLRGSRRIKTIALARQTAMFLMRTVIGTSLPEIGRLLGGKDHTTVLHACRKIHSLTNSDDQFRQSLGRIRKVVGYA